MRPETLGYVLAAVIATSAALAQTPPSIPRDKLITPPPQAQESPQSPDQSQGSRQPNQQSSPSIPPHIDVTVSGNVNINSPFQARNGDNKHDEGFYNVKVTDAIIAAFTVLLVAGTFLLWDATRRLWKSADEEL